jgi:hypothetical protein
MVFENHLSKDGDSKASKKQQRRKNGPVSLRAALSPRKIFETYIMAFRGYVPKSNRML